MFISDCDDYRHNLSWQGSFESWIAIEQLGSWVCAIKYIALSHLISTCNQIDTHTEFEITCGHWSISICLPSMTDRKGTWSVGVTDQTCTNTISFAWCMTYLTTRVRTSQFLFSPFFYEQILVTQFLCFPTFFPPSLYMFNPTWILISLVEHTHIIFWFVIGIRHDLAYSENDHSKFKVLGYNYDCSTFNPYFDLCT